MALCSNLHPEIQASEHKPQYSYENTMALQKSLFFITFKWPWLYIRASKAVLHVGKLPWSSTDMNMAGLPTVYDICLIHQSNNYK